MMENLPPSSQNGQPGSNGLSRRRSASGGGILSKLPFIRTSESKSNLKEPRHVDIVEEPLDRQQQRPLAAITQDLKTRKRKGSLRKVALLGRGAQREKRDLKPLAIDTNTQTLPVQAPSILDASSGFNGPITSSPPLIDSSPLGLGISDDTPRPSMEGYARRLDIPVHPPPPIPDTDPQIPSPTISYTSTTDEEDVLSLKKQTPPPLRPGLSSLSSGSESYFGKAARAPSVSLLQRRRSVKHAKSPLSLTGLSASPIPPPETDHDYSETEWWGWVVLVVTWTVFVVGMGSCIGVWSWAWDVGTTPYAPPEFEDDPTLPIVGYYPSLMILTCIMAWIWVITAWVGMKYFRHAKISGD